MPILIWRRLRKNWQNWLYRRMKKVHIVIPDLLLPQHLSVYASADLRLPALEKMLARARLASLEAQSLEACLCKRFGVDETAIAPLTLKADGVMPGMAYCLRADPVNISMQRDQSVLQADIGLMAEEAAQLCASLNAHFAVDGLRFIAPHPQRWYLQLDVTPQIHTYPLPQVVGADVHTHLPYGADALRWHSLFNEIQMLFYGHAVNMAREQRGEPVVSAVWLWGGGKLGRVLQQPYARVAGDSELARALAQADGNADLLNAGRGLAEGWADEQGDLLLVYEGLRSALHRANLAEWRSAVQQFEKNYAAPVLAALAAGKIGEITLDVPSESASRRFILARPALWKIWRRPWSLLQYSAKQDTP